MNDLQILDLFERLRGWILERRPTTEKDLQALLDRAIPETPDERRLSALAAFLGIENDTSAARRTLRAIARRVEEEQEVEPRDREPPRSPASAGKTQGNAVREDDLETRFGLDAPRIRRIQRLWGWVDQSSANPRGRARTGGTLETARERQLQVAEGESLSPERQVRDLCTALPFLKGLAPFRVLRGLGCEIPIPDHPRQRFLFRVGMRPDPPRASPPSRFAAFETIVRLSRIAGQSVRATDHLLGLFCGVWGERVMPGTDDISLCRSVPRCPLCPLKEFCLFHQMHSARGEAPSRKAIKAWSKEDRPRERLAHHGVEALSDAELLAIVLRTGSDECSAIDLAQNLLSTFESLERLDQASLPDLQAFHGVGPAKAVGIKAALELGKRSLRTPVVPGRRLTNSREVYQAMRSALAGQKREQFLLLALNTKNEILRTITISIGNLSQSLVHPREVFREAIREAAASVMLVHNHPSGDPTPSRDDILITSRLCRAGELLGIRVLDHLIIGSDRYYSFADEGRLSPTDPEDPASQGRSSHP